MVAAIRPGWSKHTSGIPIDVVVRIAASQGARQDINASRNRVALIRPGSLQPKPEDEYEVHFVYGPEAQNKDIHDRTVQPLLSKLLDGFNVSVIVLGATGSGKTTTLEGQRGQDARHSSGSGLIHIAADELFDMLHSKAVAVGQEVAKKRRMPTAKGFDFFVECSYVELYNEQCRDLLARGSSAQASLPIVEDPLEGYQVSGLSTKVSKTADELRTAFNWGREQRNNSATELGNAHDRTASIFTITVAQYTPAMTVGQEDVVLVSRLLFVDTPGAERLAMDADVLRLREGLAVNKSLISFANVVRQLATDNSAIVNYEESLMTRLLSDVLGGNCVTSIIGTVKQGQWEQSSSTLRVLTNAHSIRNYPLINHNRARGYLYKLRYRTLSVTEDRDTLNEQLHDVPAEGDPTRVGLNMAKIRDLEKRLIEERAEKAELVKDKEALQLRLASFKDSTADEVREKAELQEALIRSEEARLEISRNLIDFQLEYNEAKAFWEQERFKLEQRIMELEAKHVETFVRTEDHAALVDERDKFQTDYSTFKSRAHILQHEVELLKDQMGLLEKERHTLRSTLESERLQAEKERNELARYKSIAETLEASARGDPSALVHLSNQISDARERLELEMREKEQLKSMVEKLRGEIISATGRAPQMSFMQSLAPAQTGPGGPMAASANNPMQAMPAYYPAPAPMQQYQGMGGDDGMRPRKHAGEEQAERSLMQATIAVKDRKLQEQQVEMNEMQKEVDRLRIAHTNLQTQLEEGRMAYRKKLEMWTREMIDIGRVAGLMQRDPDTNLKITPEGLAEKLAQLVIDILQEYETREDGMSRDFDRLQARHSELRRKFRAIYLAYRQLRYRVEDSWPIGTGDGPPRCPREDDVVGAAPEELFRAEEEADRKDLARLREQVAKLQSELSRHRLALGKSFPPGLMGERGSFKEHPSGSMAIKLENMRLRAELEQLRSMAPVGAPVFVRQPSFDDSKLRAENNDLRARLAECNRNDRTRAQMINEIADLKAQVDKLRSLKTDDPQKAAAAALGLRKQIKEFALNTQLELERKLQAAETRAVMAEEQLESLQQYMSEASVTYQREIVRLRGMLANLQQSNGTKGGAQEPQTAPRAQAPAAGGFAAAERIRKASLQIIQANKQAAARAADADTVKP